MTTPAYSPISPLPSNWSDMRGAQLASLADAWKQQRVELDESDALTQFLSRLRREWAIETGVIERLYTVSDSATKTLIEGGIDASLLSTSDTDKPVSEVVAMIKDQEDAIAGIYSFVAESRPLSAVFIRQLHSTLTRHQTHCEAIDSLGIVRQVPLERGVWKSQPNNLGEGAPLSFAPPHLVDTEIDNLVTWANAYAEEGVSADVLAAWLHHRFTQIHPFQDGNGRLARCLATIMMIRAGWFPLVVTRNDKVDYIAALRAADRGDLHPLVNCFGHLQRKAMYKAMSIGGQVIHDTTQMRDIFGGIEATLSKIRDQKLADESRVYQTADALHKLCSERLREVSASLLPVLKKYQLGFDCTVPIAARGSVAANEYGRGQVLEASKQLGYYPDLAGYRCVAFLRIDAGRRFELTFDFHGLGRRRMIGQTLCCAAIFVEKGANGELARVAPMAKDLFELTDRDAFEQTTGSFRVWFDAAIRSGLAMWQQSL
jgi:fido (protein-threonine AMPylation protein)